MFKGSLVALVTPMLVDGTLDRNSLCSLIEWHIAEKTDALVVSGSTGESATLNLSEQAELIKLAVKQARGRIPIIAGTGSNSTQIALQLTQNAYAAKADACLIVTPYYNRPTQAGLYAHYFAIAQQTKLPIILYNVPSRTACDLLPATIVQLSQHPQIIAIKEATGSLARAQEIAKLCGDKFLIYSGDDATAFALLREIPTAAGVISVTANLTPRAMHDFCESMFQQDYATADAMHQRLIGLHQDLFMESNPIPIKWALSKVGKIKPFLRLPLLPLSAQYHDKLYQTMLQAGVQ